LSKNKINILVPSFEGNKVFGSQLFAKNCHFFLALGTILRIELIKLTASRPEARKFVTAGPQKLPSHKDYSS
jgi:hypothetical protein